MPSAPNLAKAGYRLQVCNRTAAKAQPLLARDGVSLAQTPVFGRPDRAESAELIVVSAGAPSDRERARQLLETIGSAVHDVGDDPASANAVKLAGNRPQAWNDPEVASKVAFRPRRVE